MLRWVVALILAGLAFRVLATRFLAGPRRHAAVLNALLAKLTLPTLDDSTQRAVVERARAIHAGGGKAQKATAEEMARVSFDHMSEFQRYSLYSLAMMELSVQPSINEQWSPPPRNPFVMRINERDVAVQAYYLKRHHGIDTNLGIGAVGVASADPTSIRWCKTCRHYRRIKAWDGKLLYMLAEMPTADLLPCRIPDETRDVWLSFFAREWQQRSLFPKNCPKWQSK